MPHIPSNLQINSGWNIQQLMVSLQKSWQQLAQVVNNNLSFGNPTLPLIQGGVDNIKGRWVAFNFVSANTDTTFTHNLGYVPVGYVAMSKSAACDIYTGVAAWTDTTITLRGTVAGVTGYVFVL